MSCPDSASLIQPYVDGELTGSDRESLERHMSECRDCSGTARMQARFKAAVRGHLPPPRIPAYLRARITTSLDEAERSPKGRMFPAWPWFSRLAPAVAAAGVLTVVFFTARERISPLVEQALRNHNREMPLDIVTSDCSAAATWMRKMVDFNVRPPAMDKVATCKGGRLVNVTDKPDQLGAVFQYNTRDNGRRINVMVVDGVRDNITARNHRVLRGRDVYFGSERGTSTATYRGQGDVWYVVTSDLDESALSNVVETTFTGN